MAEELLLLLLLFVVVAVVVVVVVVVLSCQHHSQLKGENTVFWKVHLAESLLVMAPLAGAVSVEWRLMVQQTQTQCRFSAVFC